MISICLSVVLFIGIASIVLHERFSQAKRAKGTTSEHIVGSTSAKRQKRPRGGRRGRAARLQAPTVEIVDEDEDFDVEDRNTISNSEEEPTDPKYLR